MAVGPGRYDDLCTKVREEAQADAVVVAVINGRVGSGFSVQATGLAVVKLPALLRDLASQLEADMWGSDGQEKEALN
jgi:hypothetical protein